MVAGEKCTGRRIEKLGLVGLVASSILLIAISGLYQHSDRTFLVDGTTTQHTFALPELMDVSYNNPGATVFGIALVKALWVALFIPFMLLAAVAPLHTWLVNVIDEAAAPVAALIAAVAVEVGVYGMLRFNYGILPEGTRWAAGATSASALRVSCTARSAHSRKPISKNSSRTRA